MIGNVHCRNTSNLSDPGPQFFITSGNDETSVRLGHLHKTIIGITSLTAAGYSFKSRIFGQLKSDFILGPEFFKFSHDTIRDAGYTLSQKTVHHGPHHIHFIPNGKVDKVGIDQDTCTPTHTPLQFSINGVESKS